MLVAAIMLASVAAGGLHYYHQRTGNVYHPNAPFIPEAPPQLPVRRIARTAWPMYGFTENHTRVFPAAASLRPPFRIVWVRGGGHALLEFPPVLYGNSLFQLGDNATLTSVDKQTGRQLWSRHLGALSASSPAVANGAVFVTIMQREPGLNAGRVVALNATTGAIRWSRDLPSPSESSPLIDGHRLYLGSTDGTVYALSTDNGSTQWIYRAAGAVKASPTLAYGNLYFGDYSGHVQSVRASSGARLWVAGSGGKLFGNGQFYSTAAVIDGRVFLGNTDGRIYAYDAGTGSLDWAVQTGAYVYSSPAVATAPGLGPTVYSGSYDGNFYAIDARTGHVQWTYHAGGRISGSATVIGRIVYFADLGARETIGLGISTGRRVFGGYPGSFDPVVTDGTRVYLTGYTGLIALIPRTAVAAAPRAAVAARPAPSAPATTTTATVVTTTTLLAGLARDGRPLSTTPGTVAAPARPPAPAPRPAPPPYEPPVPFHPISSVTCGEPAVGLLSASTAADCGWAWAP